MFCMGVYLLTDEEFDESFVQRESSVALEASFPFDARSSGTPNARVQGCH